VWILAAFIVSFDWARDQWQMSAFDCVYCVTVTNTSMNVEIIVWVPVVPVVPVRFIVTGRQVGMIYNGF